MQKILFVVGPTAVGKTEFALKLAKKFDGELVNADSVQVYKGLNIISGKDIPSNSSIRVSSLFLDHFSFDYYLFDDTPTHLLDVVDVNYSFNLYDYSRISNLVIEDIWSRNKLPIIVGGNGFYIDSFFNDIPNISVPPNPVLRKRLENKTKEELQIILGKKSKERLSLMNNSDRNNERRLIRAIEVLSSMNQNKPVKKVKFESLIVGLRASREKNKQLIKKRVDARIIKGAFIEAKTLFKNYEKLSPQVKKASGYKEMFSVLKREILLNEGIEKWKKSDISYAKKQMTWFGKNKNVIWADTDSPSEKSMLESKILEWYNKVYEYWA